MSLKRSAKRLSTFTLLVVALLAGGTLFAFADGPAMQSTASVYWTADGSTVPGAWSTLVRNDAGVSMTLHTAELPAKDAFTVWWIIFNNPEYCTAGVGPVSCGLGDLLIIGGDPAVQSSVLYAAGHVVGGSGRATFAAHLSVGDTKGALFGPGLLYPRTAEVHLVVRSHGQLLPGLVDEQIHTFAGGCPPNTCTDLQASAHP